MLEKFDKQLNQKFKTNIIFSAEEDYSKLFFSGKSIILFSIKHLSSEQKSVLMAYEFDATTGEKKTEKELIRTDVKPWTESMGKGAVKTSFCQEICFSLPSSFITPYNYQYVISFSPDAKSIFVYQYDYAQKYLVANTWFFDLELNLKQQAIVPIDNGFVNHGLYPTNKGDVYILNADRSGRVVTVWYDPDTKQNRLLDIQSTNSIRNSLKMVVLSEEVVYVAGTTLPQGKESIDGIMYAKFDFKQMIVDKINLYDISQNIQQTASSVRSRFKNCDAEDNWKNYEIANFIVNEFEKVIVVLEKRELMYTGYSYSALSVLNPKNISEKPGRVNTEAILMFSFNKDDEMLWENYYMKSQTNDISAGITISSFSMDITDDGRIRVFYPSSDNSAGTYNVINYVEWDELSGMKSKELRTPNEEGLSMLTDYTLWWQDRVVVVGRKGMLGKKSFINLYKLEVN